MTVYYNEFDPNAAAWLRQLILNGDIAPGIVDERSITEVQADDLRGFTQVHFFAGIGGWSAALRLANWPDNRPVFTGSCPCQPFSAAGNNKGKKDERHLWPYFYRLISECKPDTVFGEQVEGAIKHGWLDDLQTDLEREGYAVGHCVLGAHSVGAPHIRQRLYWVANANIQHWWKQQQLESGIGEGSWYESGRGGGINERMADSVSARLEGQLRNGDNGNKPGRVGSDTFGSIAKGCGDSGDWSNPDWIYCRDNKYRPIKPGIKPLVDGVYGKLVRGGDPGEPINANETQEARVMRLKGYGNAINPYTAAAFILASGEAAA